MKKLTKDQVQALSTTAQVEYVNELTKKYAGSEWLYEDTEGNIIDRMSCGEYEDTIVEDVYVWLCDTNNCNGCDLYNQCFLDDKNATSILETYLINKGIKKNYLCEELDINISTFSRKMECFTFTHAELCEIRRVLHLSDDEFLKLF